MSFLVQFAEQVQSFIHLVDLMSWSDGDD